MQTLGGVSDYIHLCRILPTTRTIMMSPISLPADLFGGERPKITGHARHKDGGQAYGAHEKGVWKVCCFYR